MKTVLLLSTLILLGCQKQNDKPKCNDITTYHFIAFKPAGGKIRRNISVTFFNPGGNKKVKQQFSDLADTDTLKISYTTRERYNFVLHIDRVACNYTSQPIDSVTLRYILVKNKTIIHDRHFTNVCDEYNYITRAPLNVPLSDTVNVCGNDYIYIYKP
jgi:hypothetical protein